MGGIIGAAVGLVAAGAPTILSGIGKTFLEEGTKSALSKFATDLTAYVSFGKEMGGLEIYMSAFVFGGTTGLLGLKGGMKKAVDILVRPAYNILVEDVMFKGEPWSNQKYMENVAIRCATGWLPDDLKPIIRGFINGFNYQSKSGSSNEIIVEY